MLPILHRELVGSASLANHGRVAGSVCLVEPHDALKVDLLLVRIASLSPLLAQLLVIVVPSFQGILVELIELCVGLWVDVDDEVHHTLQHVLIDNGISSSFANILLRELRASRPWNVLWGLIVSRLQTNLLAQELDGSTKKAGLFGFWLRSFLGRFHLCRSP